MRTTNTGNEIVDAVAKINFTGNIIPESWYKTIVNEKGKTNTLALLILSDIVYWYRPKEVREEYSTKVTYEKKFHSDILQRSYAQICDKFNCSNKQAREALILLENLGIIKRVFRTIEVNEVRMSNVMFIELFPEALLKVTYIDEDIDNSSADTLFTKKETPISEEEGSLQNGKGVFTKKEIASSQKGKTNTKTTTKITTETITTNKESIEDVVVEAEEIFCKYDLTRNDIISILKAADYSVEKCKKALVVFENQKTKVRNVVGWFIEAVKLGYDIESKAVSSGRFNSFRQREYDFDELEKCMLGYST